MYIADLHVHTTASDGLLEPEEVVAWSIKKKLTAIAITDHDTIKGIERAIQKSMQYTNFRVIPGIEISSEYSDKEVHILGYFADYHRSNLESEITKFAQARINRGEKIVEKLQKIGISITFDEVKAIAKEGVIGRPHIARVLLKKGYVQTMEEAFDKYLGDTKPAYVKKYKLTIKEAVDLIHRNGGISILAHPGLLENQDIIKLAIEDGLDGLEIFYPRHSEAEIARYIKLATKYRLIVTGGSDWHGIVNNGKVLLGEYGISKPYLEDFFRRLNKDKEEDCSEGRKGQKE